MKQAEIEAEVWRNIREVQVPIEEIIDGSPAIAHRPMVDLGNITAWFGPGDIAGGVHFETDGDPSLGITIVPRDGERHFDVHVTHIGDLSAYHALEERWAAEVDEWLPNNIFIAGDKFLADYRQHLPASARHYATYSEVCRRLKPRSILEIGVRAGYSAWAMLRAVPDATYVGIDADNGTNGGIVGYMDHAATMLRREYPAASIMIERADSQNFLSLDRRYDLIHIDGAHNHDQTLHDLAMCAPHADYLIIDDTTFITTVQSALIEFLEANQFKAWRHDTWHGIVLIDTRSAKGTTAARYCPQVFDAPTMRDARDIILQANELTTDERWEQETAWLMQRMMFPQGTIFDVGCGIGRLSKPLVECGNLVVGVDAAEPMRQKAIGYVADPVRFSAVSPQDFAVMVEAGRRGQGAIAVWVLQHMLAADVERMIPTLWQSLEPGALFYTLDLNYRCVPMEFLGEFRWMQDGYDVPGLIERSGFMLSQQEEPPADIFPAGNALLRRWIRRR